jgi:hypothetical protein
VIVLFLVVRHVSDAEQRDFHMHWRVLFLEGKMAPGACFRFSPLVLVQLPAFCAYNSCISNYSNCSCPGSDCSSPACGGNIFEGYRRNLSPSKNITKDSCARKSGWGGVGCNLCQTASACSLASRDPQAPATRLASSEELAS